MGVGSGILFEADPAKEYSECKLKAQFLTVPKPQFDLFETMLWEPHQGFRNLTFHLERIERSAQYSLFKYDPEQIQQDLDSIQKKLQISNKPSRVRLKLSESGESLIETEEILPLTEPVRVVMSEIRTDSKDRFLYHKTTARHLYEAEYLAAKQKGYFDVIFRNERDEITEGAISNIFIEKNGTLFTPPINSGLLAGTFRRFVLQSGDWDAQEKVLTVEDLKIADRIYASNAIRGLVEVRLDL
jgi:para-aminobenzoate synthetase/4-amino-4-deoxychorismate lyase